MNDGTLHKSATAGFFSTVRQNEIVKYNFTLKFKLPFLRSFTYKDHLCSSPEMTKKLYKRIKNLIHLTNVIYLGLLKPYEKQTKIEMVITCKYIPPGRDLFSEENKTSTKHFDSSWHLFEMFLVPLFRKKYIHIRNYI